MGKDLVETATEICVPPVLGVAKPDAKTAQKVKQDALRAARLGPFFKTEATLVCASGRKDDPKDVLIHGIVAINNAPTDDEILRGLAKRNDEVVLRVTGDPQFPKGVLVPITAVKQVKFE